MNIEEKLFRVRLHPDSGGSHITIEKSLCDRCEDKVCLHVCPAEVYSLGDEGQIAASYHGCLECGTCRRACTGGAITWRYPKGGFGVCYRFG